MIGSPERVKIQRSSIPKFRRFIAALGSYRSKLSKQSILAPKGQIFVLNGQNLAKSELSRHIEYDFLKEDHKNNFHTENWEDS